MGNSQTQGMAAPVERIVWSPGSNFAQWSLLQSDVFEVFFGGARGGGKSDAMLGDWMFHADRYGENASGLMIRRTYVELADIIERSRVIYSPLRWTYTENEKVWRAPNGARLKFAYLDRDSDAEGYQGHSYTKLYVEEAGNFPSPAPISRMRSGGVCTFARKSDAMNLAWNINALMRTRSRRDAIARGSSAGRPSRSSVSRCRMFMSVMRWIGNPRLQPAIRQIEFGRTRMAARGR